MKKIILIIAIIVLTITACSSNCPKKELLAAGEAIQNQVTRFESASAIADSTPRMQLGAQLINLDKIRSDTKVIEIPVCMEQYKKSVVFSMDNIILGFTAFMAQEKDSVIIQHFKDARKYMDFAIGELDRLAKCAPNCE